MKKITFFISLLFIIGLFFSPITSFAINSSYRLDDLPPDVERSILTSGDYKAFSTEPSKKQPFERFAVRSDGGFAIGYESWNDSWKTICVYDSDGSFSRGYSVRSSGTIGLEWDDDTLLVWSARSSVVVSLDEHGKPLQAKAMAKVNDNYMKEGHLYSNYPQKIGDTTYEAEGRAKGFLSDASLRLVAKDENGVRVLYEADVEQSTGDPIPDWAIVAFVIVVITLTAAGAIVGAIVYRRIKKNPRA